MQLHQEFSQFIKTITCRKNPIGEKEIRPININWECDRAYLRVRFKRFLGKNNRYTEVSIFNSENKQLESHLNLQGTYKSLKVFDWLRAAELITKHGNTSTVYAGLLEDWPLTNMIILKNKKIVPSTYYTIFLSSVWATPALCINKMYFNCYRVVRYGEQNLSIGWPQEAANLVHRNSK